MKHNIITISRQYGSGGHLIGERLSADLDIPYYDQDVIKEIALSTGLNEDFISEKGRYLDNSGWFYSLTSRSRFETNPQDRVWKATQKAIRELSLNGPCIFIGRCADYILADQDPFRIFVTANLQDRIERAKEMEPEAVSVTKEELLAFDRKRETFYKYYTDLHWGDARNYDLCLNTSLLGIDRCVELIKELL